MRNKEEILIGNYLSELENSLRELLTEINNGYYVVLLGTMPHIIDLSESHKILLTKQAAEALEYIIRCRIKLIKIRYCDQ